VVHPAARRENGGVIHSPGATPLGLEFMVRVDPKVAQSGNLGLWDGTALR